MIFRLSSLSLVGLAALSSAQTIPSTLLPDFTSAPTEANYIRNVHGIAEMRRGNNATNGTWEVGAYPGGSAANPGAQTMQYAWGTRSHDFTLTYVASTKVTTLTVTDGIATQTATSSTSFAPSALWVRARGSAAGAASVSNLKLAQSGNAALSLSADAVSGALGSVAARAIQILDIDSTQNWTLTGSVVLSEGTNSNTAVQIKMGEAVPEPASMAALAAGAAFLARRRRQR